MTISMDIKPRTPNALLLSVHGKRAMFSLQIDNGSITFTVDNGGGLFKAIFKPEQNQNFCDGEWHTVKAIKSQYVITLNVDNVSSDPAIGDVNHPFTNTKRPLFLGGHPYLQKARDLSIRRPYIGCIRNVKIKDVTQKIHTGIVSGKAQVGACPLT